MSIKELTEEEIVELKDPRFQSQPMYNSNDNALDYREKVQEMSQVPEK